MVVLAPLPVALVDAAVASAGAGISTCCYCYCSSWQIESVEDALARLLERRNVRDLDRAQKRVAPVLRAPDRRLRADTKTAELFEGHALTCTADRAMLHLQVVAGVPLALETYVHDSFGTKVLFAVLCGRRGDEGAPGGEGELGAAVDGRGEEERVRATAAVVIVGAGFAAVIVVALFSAEVGGEGGQDAQTVVFGGRADQHKIR